MIDSHCHLADKQFADDVEQVIARAHEAGVTKMIVIADSLPEYEGGLKIAQEHDGIWCTCGVHPHNADQWVMGNEQLVVNAAQGNPEVVAVGEIGLDYFYDNSPRDVQQDVFRAQLLIAKELNVPAVVHCREAVEDLKQIITEVNPPSLVVHCCTEKWEDVAELVERGHFLSFTGIATYPKSEEIRETIKHCPLEQLMIETDAPYLAPVPHRGKRNEPAYVVEVAKCIAEVKGISLEEVDRQTTTNTVEFFGLT